MYPETVSLCIVALNEENILPKLLEDVYSQTYPHQKTQVVLVDSGSSDATKKIMENFAKENKDEYISVTVADNPKRIQASGWNVAIINSVCDVIIRVDAHTSIPCDFIELNMKNLQSGEYVSGGVRPCIIENKTLWGKALLEAENSLFGSSIGKARSGTKKEYVKTMFHGAYRRSVFADTGGFNEKLLRTEDNELHFRIRKAGYKLCFDPQILSYQYARSSFRKMIKQKYGNGYWIGLTLGVCPGCISAYHLIPFAFLIGIIATGFLAARGIWQPGALMWGAYLAFALISTAASIAKKGFNPFFLLIPFFFLTLHISYGVGTLTGICSIPFKSRHLNSCEMIETVKSVMKEFDENENNIYKSPV